MSERYSLIPSFIHKSIHSQPIEAKADLLNFHGASSSVSALGGSTKSVPPTSLIWLFTFHLSNRITKNMRLIYMLQRHPRGFMFEVKFMNHHNPQQWVGKIYLNFAVKFTSLCLFNFIFEAIFAIYYLALQSWGYNSGGQNQISRIFPTDT